MGYTVKPADEYIGMGLTSISFLENTFIHNHKALPEYYRLLEANTLPVEKGKILSMDDQTRQWTINALMCQFLIDKQAFKERFHVPFDGYFSQEQEHIHQCVEDQLVNIENEKIKVTELGKIFIRNVCMGFDFYLRQKDSPKRFSKAI
jgi:oxygen-independent coproporphyrinogen-3 oxidase